MRVRTLKSGATVKYDYDFVPQFSETRPSPKHNVVLERRVERLLQQSESLGWNFSDFVAHLSEIMIVMRHRNSLKTEGRE